MKRKTTISMENNSKGFNANLTKLVLLVFVIFGVQNLFAQSTANYSFTTNATSSLASDINSNTVDMTIGTTQLLAANLDDTASSVTNIGFDFFFYGSLYTQFSVSDNGLIGLGSTVISGTTYACSGGSVTTPRLSAFCADTRVGTSGKIHYKVVGSAPNRCLVIEFSNMSINYIVTSGSNDGTFQVRLYESTGIVEYVYGAMSRNSGTGASTNATSIGFSVGTALNTTASVTTSSNTVVYTATFNTNTYTAGSGAITNLNSTSNGSRRTYRFTPTTAAAPTNLTFTNVALGSMTLNWIDNATNELGYVIYSSTDNINFNYLGQLPANSTGANVTGLNPSTLYYWKVHALKETLSTALTGSQSTLAGGVVYTANGSFTVPCYVTSLKVEAWGGGGKGGDRTAGNNVALAGGGGGAYSSSVLTTFSSPYTITVGLGSTTTAAGGDSSFGSSVIAKGGGSVADNSNTRGTEGLATGGTGTTKYNGGRGSAGTAGSFGGGGGSSAGSAAVGNFTTNTTQNAGAVAPLNGGDGSDGAVSGTAAFNGSFPGGGGGGGYRAGAGTTQAAGDGGNGQVIVSWTCPTATIAYAGGPFCKSLTSATVTITGTDARTTCTNTFSSTPAGLSINATTGAINPSLSTAGTYTVSYQLASAGGCAAVNATTSVTINALPVVSAGSQVCIGSTITISPTTGGTWASSNGNATVTNAGVVTGVTAGTSTFTFTNTITGCSATTSSVTINALPIVTAGSQVCIGSTITLSPVTAGTWTSSNGNATVTNAGVVTGVTAGTATFTFTNTATGCSATTSSVIINPRPTASVLSGSAAICSGSTTNLQVAITGGLSPFTVVHSGGTVNTYTSGTNIPVSPSTSTTYTLTSVTDANGCVGTGNSGSAVVTIDVTTSTNGGSSWSNGTPTSTKSVVFDGSTGTIGANFSGCSLRLTNNATVSVTSGFDVTLEGKLTVDSGSTFTLNNNTNLIQNTTLANSGNIIVKRNSSALKRLDYTLWSTPVTGQGLYAFSKFTLPNRFYVYDTASDLYSNSVGFSLTGLQYPSPLVSPNGVDGSDSNNVAFTNGKSYLIRVPYNHPTTPAVYNGSFTGVANNGTISPTVSTALNGFNAVGNPYPSRLNVANFIDGNANITGPLYFWRKTNTAAVSTSYATLTKTAYVANGSAGGDTGTGFFNTGNEANWAINVGQGFLVKAASGSTISFTNSMRRSSNDDQFFRPSQTLNTATNGLYWLNLTDTAGVYSQMAVGYSSESTLGDDRGIDGKNINNEFYLTSLIGADAYAIQGRPDFDASDIVPLSYKTVAAGNYTIAIDHTAGGFSSGSQTIYLKDNLTTTIHDLNASAYTFATTAGTFEDRFEIVYQTQLITPSFSANNVIVYTQNNEIVINTGSITMASVKVFDIRGRLIEEKKGINASQTTINSGLANQVLLVQITAQDGIVVTKKVIR